MKLNLKVRLKNRAFWLTVIPALITLVYTVLGAFGVVPAISKDALMNVVAVIISALTTLGVLVDPTTNGIGDSARALTYETENDVRKGE